MSHDRTESILPAGRGQFVSGVILGLSVGLAAGHLLFFGRFVGDGTTGDDEASIIRWESLESPMSQVEIPASTSDVEFSRLDVDIGPNAGRAILPDEMAEGGLHFFPESLSSAETATSQATAQLAFVSDGTPDNSLRVAADVKNGQQTTPQALPQVSTASPIDEQTSQREQLARRLIREELPGATQQELDVWYEVLQGLPAEDIKGILRMRKRLGSGSSSALVGRVTAPGTIIGPIAEPAAAPDLLTQSVGKGRHQNSIATLRRLQDLDRQNLLHRDTIAYKRRVPVVVEDSHRDDQNGASGIRLLRVTRDMSAGHLQATGRPLDVGINGRGFLPVRREDEIRYTRSGRLGLDSERRLTVVTAQSDWLIDPPITLPLHAGTLVIETNGRVQVVPLEGGDPAELGTIPVVLFVNAEGLRHDGEGLYKETGASGRPCVTSFGATSAGQLVQGHLESSNVDEPALWERLRWQQKLIELLTE